MLDNGHVKHCESIKKIEKHFSNQGMYIAMHRNIGQLLSPVCFHNASFTLKGKHEYE